MNVKKMVAGFATTALVTVGLIVAGPISAQAHVPRVSADCDGISVNLQNYAEEVAAVPEVPAVPEIPAVTETSYARYSFTGQHTAPEGSTPLNDPDHWQADHKKYDGSPLNQVLHNGNGHGAYFYWTSTSVVVKPAIPGTPAVPAQDPKVNVVSIVIDGSTVISTDFGSSFTYSEPSPDQTVAHTYSVTVTAWDDSAYNVNFEKTVDACETAPPVVVPPVDVPEEPVVEAPPVVVPPADQTPVPAAPAAPAAQPAVPVVSNAHFTG